MRSSRTAVVLVGHGSKTRGFDAAMKKVARVLRREKRYQPVVCGFLEVARPTISEAILRCIRQGARQVRVLPYFVLTGKHVTRDIPRIVREAAQRHRGRVRVVLCPYLGYDSKIVSVVKERLAHG